MYQGVLGFLKGVRDVSEGLSLFKWFFGCFTGVSETFQWISEGFKGVSGNERNVPENFK